MLWLLRRPLQTDPTDREGDRSMLPLLGAVFFASLFGSLHCVGMCGPLALLASGGRTSQSPSRNIRAVAAYHIGRIATYAAVGGAAGLLGAGVEQTGSLLGMQRLAAQLAGGSMLVIGLLAMVRLAGGSNHAAMLPMWLQRRLASGHAWARRQPPVRRAATIGLLTALLPCGWLYAFVIVAAGTAQPLAGAAVMATFGLGSVPALAALALSMTLLVGRFRNAVPWCSAVLVTIVGAATLLHRSRIDLLPMAESAVSFTGSQASAAKLASHTQALQQSQLPCCCAVKRPADSAAPQSPLVISNPHSSSESLHELGR